MKLMVFGATGLLGTDIMNACRNDFDATGLSSRDADITDLDAVYGRVKTLKPDVVVNSAALTDVDKCEMEPDKAYAINAVGAKNIAIACRDFKARLIHISTDYVFDGESARPYTEFDEPAPINVYGRAKLAGENMARDILDNFMIIRTAWIFGETRKHFVDYVAENINKGDEIIAVKDMVSSPTYSADLAAAVKNCIAMNETGVFHAANKGYCSRVSMVEEIMRVLKKQTKVKVVNQSQWEKPAKRPKFSALKNYHFSLIDRDTMAGWRDSLKRYVKYKYGR